MQNKHFRAFADLVMLIAGMLSSLPASAQGQITYFPDISVPLNTKQIQVHSPTLNLSSVIWTSDVQFEERNSSLVITQPAMGSAFSKPAGKILWSGKLGTEPQRFAFATTNTKEELKDSTGKVIWSRETQPSLTLDFDQPGLVRLLDADGKELGTAPVDHTVPPIFPAHHYREPFFGSTSDYGGIRVEKDTGREQTTILAGPISSGLGQTPPTTASAMDVLRTAPSAASQPPGFLPVRRLPWKSLNRPAALLSPTKTITSWRLCRRKLCA